MVLLLLRRIGCLGVLSFAPAAAFAFLILTVVAWLASPFQGFSGGPPQGLPAITEYYLPQEMQAVQEYETCEQVEVPVYDDKGQKVGTKTVPRCDGVSLVFLQALMDAASGGNTILVSERDGVADFGILQLPKEAMPFPEASPTDPSWQIPTMVEALDKVYKALHGDPSELAAYAYALMTHPEVWQPPPPPSPALVARFGPQAAPAGYATSALGAEEGVRLGENTPGGPAFVAQVLSDMGSLSVSSSGPTGVVGLEPWACLVETASRDTGVPADWIGGEILTESGGDPTAGQLSGAYGLMQLEPGTMGATDAERENPTTNVLIGSEYLARLESATGSWELASAAYYGGLGTLEETLASHGLSLGATCDQALASGALDTVPFPEYGNTLTLADYIARVQGNAKAAESVLAAASCSGAAPLP